MPAIVKTLKITINRGEHLKIGQGKVKKSEKFEEN